MTEKLTVARPYAKAIFSASEGRGEVVATQQQLLLLVELFKCEKVAKMMSNNLILAHEKVEAVTGCFGDVLSEQTVALLSLLATEGRLSLLPEVYGLFVDYRQEKEGVVSVEVVSAFDMSDKERAGFDKAMEDMFSKKVESSYTKDEALIAGVVVRTKQKFIDCSLRGQLEKMKSELDVAV